MSDDKTPPEIDIQQIVEALLNICGQAAEMQIDEESRNAIYDMCVYNYIDFFITSFLGKIFVFLYFFSICYHFCNGIRHLTWDLGYGFEIKNVYITGYITIFCALLMNILLWIF